MTYYEAEEAERRLDPSGEFDRMLREEREDRDQDHSGLHGYSGRVRAMRPGDDGALR